MGGGVKCCGIFRVEARLINRPRGVYDVSGQVCRRSGRLWALPQLRSLEAVSGTRTGTSASSVIANSISLTLPSLLPSWPWPLCEFSSVSAALSPSPSTCLQ